MRQPIQIAILAFATSLFLLSACGGSDSVEIMVVEPATSQGHVNDKLLGTWRILGEGTLAEITASGVQRFQEMHSLCYPDSRPLDVAGLSGFRVRFAATSSTHPIDLLSDSGEHADATLERIESIPAACRHTPSSDPATTFRAMWEAFDLDYAFFKERSIDWPQRHSALAPKAAAASNDDQLQAVLIEALQGFNDDHVSLIRVNDGMPSYSFVASGTPTVHMIAQAFSMQNEFTDPEMFYAAWCSEVQSRFAPRLIEGSDGRVLDGAMTWGKLLNNIGYIEIARMGEFSSDGASSDAELVGRELDRALAQLKDTRALIVDVSLNIGGTDRVSAEIASRFADQRRLAFTKTAYRPQGRASQSWYVEPKGTARYLKPVYVLTSDRTISAGDVFALMMRELPHVTIAGQRTSGSMSNVLTKPLPGNFFVTLSNEIYRDSTGRSYEVTGIPPDLPIVLFDPANIHSLQTGHGEAIDRLLTHISK